MSNNKRTPPKILGADGRQINQEQPTSMVPVVLMGQMGPVIVQPPHTIAMAQILAPIVAAFAPTMTPAEAAAKAKPYIEAIFELVKTEAATEAAKQEAKNPDTQVQ